jgi:hypothetical protein
MDITESTTVFPIHRLNYRVSEKLGRIITADIPGCINKGLKNTVNLIDDGRGMTECARIEKDILDGDIYVTVSAAFMQFVWLLNDIALKSIDLGTIIQQCNQFGVKYEDYVKIAEMVSQMTPEELLSKYSLPDGMNAQQYIEYMSRTMPLMDPKLFEESIINELSLLRRLRNTTEHFNPSDFSQVNLHGKYEGAVNAVYCYSIVFMMLHELSHFALGHLDEVKERLEDEKNADMNAFWCVFSDLKGREQFTAIVGIICLLFALLMINPTMKEDGVHPREDKRIFEIYDNVKNDNPKFTVLLIKLFKIWAIINTIKDFPEVTDFSDEGLNIIRDYLNAKTDF